TPPTNINKSMDDIVALCRRRGFIFQSSEIYGGINGFWDYGPLGVLLKKNLKDAWWRDIVTCPPDGPDGQPLDMVGLDTTIIMNPKVWVASGHVQGFNDPMVDCRETKSRYRADQLYVYKPQQAEQNALMFAFLEGEPEPAVKNMKKALGKQADPANYFIEPLLKVPAYEYAYVVGPHASKPGTLTEPRMFNLMFETYIGAVRDEESKAYLRPETAQGIFANFRNVVDTSRVKVPFGIAQIGKAFRNEVTPRNFTFRSREFEQMEIEFFIHPDTAREWYQYWRDARYNWWKSIGLAGSNLQLREHEKDELAHYAKEGAGTSDVEYRFPFTSPGFGELEGVAHRTDFDLRQHAEHSGLGDKLKYFDQERNERYFPHVIEPSAGADRGTLALICEAYTPDESRPSKVFLRFHPRIAPIKAAVYPLVNKDGMPEVAHKLYRQLRGKYTVEYDAKQSIGKRYARMDEAGTPYCFTIDGQTLQDQTVTARDRDTQQQQRIAIDQVEAFLAQHIGG
ncbi:MAG TPA: glycine--tRNA ligase, partial [Phycisphaeraceae bacterium]